MFEMTRPVVDARPVFEIEKSVEVANAEVEEDILKSVRLATDVLAANTLSVPVVVAPPLMVSPPICVPSPMVEEAETIMPRVVEVGAK